MVEKEGGADLRRSTHLKTVQIGKHQEASKAECIESRPTRGTGDELWRGITRGTRG